MTRSIPPRTALILAAGEGKRMASATPKPLQRIAGHTLLSHVISVADKAGCHAPIIVIPPDDDAIAAEARRCNPKCSFVTQGEQRGTAAAVLTARDALADFSGSLLVLYSDTPLLKASTLIAMSDRCEQDDAAFCLLGFRRAGRYRFGRIILDADGNPKEIREHPAGSPSEENDGSVLFNGGAICLTAPLLWSLLDRLDTDKKSKELYLTDIVAAATERGLRGHFIEAGTPEEAFGVDDHRALARAEHIMQSRLRCDALEKGTTLIAPETVFLSTDTVLGRNVVLDPHIVIGPGVVIGNQVHIASFSHLENTHIGDFCRIGPHTRIRDHVEIGSGCRIGNFVEIKKSSIGTGVKIPHLAYIGDADIGDYANIGAGVIFCNYDGVNKHKTHIGNHAFIGSNVSLTAPLTVGDGAYLGTGSVIRRDVAPDCVVTARAEQKNHPELASEMLRRFKIRKESS